MAVRANIGAYATVFRFAVIFMAVGAVAALFVKEAKRDFATHQDLETSMEI